MNNNRIIKFRVWDSKENKMLSAVDIFNPNNGIWYEDNPDGSLHINKIINSLGYREELVMMQFTGLLDKNGKEIYEGDILNNKGENYSEFWKVYFNQDKMAWYIGCDNGDEFYDDFLFEFSVNNKSYLYVCGNIFENADLLK